MTVTIRGTDNLETSKTITVSAAGTVSCTDSDGGDDIYTK